MCANLSLNLRILQLIDIYQLNSKLFLCKWEYWIPAIWIHLIIPCMILIMAIGKWGPLEVPPPHPLAAQVVAWTSTPWLSGRFDAFGKNRQDVGMSWGFHWDFKLLWIGCPASGLVQHSSTPNVANVNCGVLASLTVFGMGRQKESTSTLQSLVEIHPRNGTNYPLGSMVPFAKLL